MITKDQEKLLVPGAVVRAYGDNYTIAGLHSDGWYSVSSGRGHCIVVPLLASECELISSPAQVGRLHDFSFRAGPLTFCRVCGDGIGSARECEDMDPALAMRLIDQELADRMFTRDTGISANKEPVTYRPYRPQAWASWALVGGAIEAWAGEERPRRR